MRVFLLLLSSPHVSGSPSDQSSRSSSSPRHDRCRAQAVARGARSQARRVQIQGQATIGPFIVDFLCVDARLIVELDGEEVDARRTAYLEAQGDRVMRFWNNEVIESFEGVLEAILRALDG